MRKNIIFLKKDKLIYEFQQYLLKTKGLSSNTIKLYCYYVKFFLSFQSKSKRICVNRILPKNIINFILLYTRREKLTSAQHMTSSLRTFFRFLELTQGLQKNLVNSVPSVANRKQRTLPASLTTQELINLLNSCDKTSILGLRDYAVLMLLSQFGLRASEICNLTLDDFDWDNSEITIRGKGFTETRFPIFQTLGNALMDYLKGSRPHCFDRHLFLSGTRPIKPQTIRRIVRNALIRANLNPTRKGVHLLRHTFAVQLLDQGASLQEIAIALRHRDINTTAIYANVDFVKLKILALPWPHKFKDGGLL